MIFSFNIYPGVDKTVIYTPWATCLPQSSVPSHNTVTGRSVDAGIVISFTSLPQISYMQRDNGVEDSTPCTENLTVLRLGFGVMCMYGDIINADA